MTGLVRKATLLSGALLLVAGVAMAGVPSAANSTLPLGIQFVGHTGGVADVKGQAVVVVRDAGNNPVINSTVELLFGACASAVPSDLNLDDVQTFAGNAVNCAGNVIVAVTNGSGQATFRIIGGASATPGNSPGITTACCTVRADGQVLGNLRVAAYDLNTSGGVNGADQSLLLATLFAGPAGYRCRADFNGNGIVDSADLSKLLSVQFGAGSLTSAAVPFCF
jgi:hypothetical protein